MQKHINHTSRYLELLRKDVYEHINTSMNASTKATNTCIHNYVHNHENTHAWIHTLSWYTVQKVLSLFVKVSLRTQEFFYCLHRLRTHSALNQLQKQ